MHIKIVNDDWNKDCFRIETSSKVDAKMTRQTESFTRSELNMLAFLIEKKLNN